MANIPLKSIKFPGLPDTYTIAAQETADIASLKSALNNVAGGSVVLFNDGGYMKNYSTAEYTGTPVSNSDWQWAKVDCAPGDAFTLEHMKGGSSARVFAFFTDEDELIDSPAASAKNISTYEVIYAPEDAAFAVFNNNKTEYDDAFIVKGNYIWTDIRDLRGKFSSIASRTQNMFDMSVFDGVTGITKTSDGYYTGTAQAFHNAFSEGVPGLTFESGQYFFSVVGHTSSESTSGNALRFQLNYSNSAYNRTTFDLGDHTDTTRKIQTGASYTVTGMIITYGGNASSIWFIKDIMLCKSSVEVDYVPYLSANDYIARHDIEGIDTRLTAAEGVLDSIETSATDVPLLEDSLKAEKMYVIDAQTKTVTEYATLATDGHPKGTAGDNYGVYSYSLQANTPYKISGTARWALGSPEVAISFLPTGGSTYQIIMYRSTSSAYRETVFTPDAAGTLYIEHDKAYGEMICQKISGVRLRTSPRTDPVKRRIALIGDSVTWGSGPLASGYCAALEKLVYQNGETVTDGFISTDGTVSTISSDKFFGGKATQLSGVSAEIVFGIDSETINLCSAFPRSNAAAAIVGVYIDDVLQEKFSTYNPNPSGTATATFTGDGTTKIFSLGRAFTYGHTVTVGGTAQTGRINPPGSGHKVYTGEDYLIIRKSVDGAVVHCIMFDDAPASGASISCAYSYGESVCYEKCSVGETGAALDSGLESYYGDGDIAFDPDAATSISSGLDFRSVNPAAFRTYKFGEKALRKVRIVIEGADPRATTTPIYVFNMATANDFAYMNAGIGGFTYAKFDEDTGLTSWKRFMEFNPDAVFMLNGANDDWNCATYPVYQARTVPEAWLDENSMYWSDAFAAAQTAGYYDIRDRWVNIATNGITPYSVTLSADVTVKSTPPAAGDIVIIGKYPTDERYCQVRIIESWNSVTRTLTFKQPIDTAKCDANTRVLIKGIAQYGTNLTSVIDKIKGFGLKPVDIYVGCPGIPNMYVRELLGYREYIAALCDAEGVHFVDLYGLTSDFSAHQRQNISVTITSTGAASYDISTAYGSTISPLLRNVSVTVDGVEVYDGHNVYVCGGTGSYANHSNFKKVSATRPTVLHFADPPTSGKTIVVKGSTAVWSGDYCHMHQAASEPGRKIYAQAVYDAIFK